MLYLATRNAHKIAEVRAILGIEVAGVPKELPEPIEDGVTFAANASIKALQVARALNAPALADDSGLCVDVLGGAPGIFSARWAGRHGDDRANLELLLAQLSDVKEPNRTARFHCAAALALPDGTVIVTEGEMLGELRFEPAGAAGFGYDPIFQPAGYDVTAAQLSPEEKNAISHRRMAFTKLAAHLERLGL